MFGFICCGKPFICCGNYQEIGDNFVEAELINQPIPKQDKPKQDNRVGIFFGEKNRPNEKLFKIIQDRFPHLDFKEVSNPDDEKFKVSLYFATIGTPRFDQECNSKLLKKCKECSEKVFFLMTNFGTVMKLSRSSYDEIIDERIACVYDIKYNFELNAQLERLKELLPPKV